MCGIDSVGEAPVTVEDIGGSSGHAGAEVASGRAPPSTTATGAQHDDPSRDARQLPSGVILSRGTGGPGLSSEPCNNAPELPPGGDRRRARLVPLLALLRAIKESQSRNRSTIPRLFPESDEESVDTRLSSFAFARFDRLGAAFLEAGSWPLDSRGPSRPAAAWTPSARTPARRRDQRHIPPQSSPCHCNLWSRRAVNINIGKRCDPTTGDPVCLPQRVP